MDKETEKTLTWLTIPTRSELTGNIDAITAITTYNAVIFDDVT